MDTLDRKGRGKEKEKESESHTIGKHFYFPVLEIMWSPPPPHHPFNLYSPCVMGFIKAKGGAHVHAIIITIITTMIILIVVGQSLHSFWDWCPYSLLRMQTVLKNMNISCKVLFFVYICMFFKVGVNVARFYAFHKPTCSSKCASLLFF